MKNLANKIIKALGGYTREELLRSNTPVTIPNSLILDSDFQTFLNVTITGDVFLNGSHVGISNADVGGKLVVFQDAKYLHFNYCIFEEGNAPSPYYEVNSDVPPNPHHSHKP